MKNMIKKDNLFAIIILLVVSVALPIVFIIISGFTLLLLIGWLISATIAFLIMKMLAKINNPKIAFAIWTVLFLVYVLLLEIFRQPAIPYTSGVIFGIIVASVNNKGKFQDIVSKGKSETSE